MKKYWFITLSALLSVVALLFLSGCESLRSEESDEFLKDGHVRHCPKTSDDVSWYTYGRMSLNDVGPDSTAWSIVEDCGWVVHDNHRGGVGGTLQIMSSNGSVIFVWAYNSFYGFNLEQGWSGTTDKGAYIGMDYDAFHLLHPEMDGRSLSYSEFEDDDTRAQAFFEDGYLYRLYVGYYLRY